MARRSIPPFGRVVAITGAARGIGRATAEHCIRGGMQVSIGDVDLEAAQRTASELGGGTIAVELDVRERASVAGFLDETEARLGPLDVLVNNAGIMPLKPLVDEDDASAQRQVDVNVHGVLHGMKEALPRMVARNSGHVLNIASIAGRMGFAGGATYSGTKHFVVGVSEAVRAELRGTGVEITCVMPAIVRTELSSGLAPGHYIKHVEVDDVAAAIVAAMGSPRFEVYVPRTVTPLVKLGAALPQPVREGFCRILRIDRSLMDPDLATRRDYELRASRTERALRRSEEA